MCITFEVPFYIVNICYLNSRLRLISGQNTGNKLGRNLAYVCNYIHPYFNNKVKILDSDFMATDKEQGLDNQ